VPPKVYAPKLKIELLAITPEIIPLCELSTVTPKPSPYPMPLSDYPCLPHNQLCAKEREKLKIKNSSVKSSFIFFIALF
jgi:hypothetical protein